MIESHDLARQLAHVIRRHGMLEASDRVLVAVSGGADSVCLARILAEMGFDLAIAHVNHALRGGESDRDEEFVRALAASLGVRFFRHSAPVEAGSGNLEAAARKSRRAFLDSTMKRHGLSRTALAHSRDDRVETFFLHLARGSGPEGLTSMRPVAGPIIRPLIETSRRQIEAYLSSIGQSWRSDASNLDTRFRRNRMRHAVIPALAAAFNSRLSDSVTRTVEILAAESDWMELEAEAWLDGRWSRHGQAFVMDISDLDAAPVALARRVLRRALRMAGSSLENVGYDHIEQVRTLLEPGKGGKLIQVPGQVRVVRNHRTLIFQPEAGPPPDYEHVLPLPGRVLIPEIGAAFEARLVGPQALKPNGHNALVDGASLGAYVKIRNWKSGDFYNPDGRPGSKLKKLFQERRISVPNRRRWPVVVARSSIVWVAPFPVSRDFVPTDSSQSIVELKASLSPEMSYEAGP